MGKLIILVGLIFVISCASYDDDGREYTDPFTTYGGSDIYSGSHIVDRPSSPFVGGFDVFRE